MDEEPGKVRNGLSLPLAMLPAILVALAVSIPSLGHGFVYDDVAIIADREIVQDGKIGSLLTETYWPEARGASLWRPGALVAFSAQWSLGDGNPAVFHGVNVLLYAGVTGLLALLAGWLFGPAVGLVSGLLFAAHPAHVEVTANVVGQAELIPALCYLAVLCLAWKSVTSEGGRRLPVLAGAALLTLVGVAVKEHMVTLPGAVLVLWWLAAHRSGSALKELARREWAFLLAVAVPLALYLVGRALVVGGVADSGGLAPGLDPDSVLQRLTVMLPVSAHWFRLLFWPLELSADYGPAHLVPRPEFGVLHGTILIAWLVLLSMAWHFRARTPEVAVGLGLFLVTISVVSNIVVPLEILLAERLLFLPSAGWAIALGGLVSRAAASAPKSLPLVFASVMVVTLLLAWRSVERVPAWSDNDSFFLQMGEDAPRTFRLPWLAAEQAVAEGDLDRADQLFLETLRRNPYDPRLWEQLGLMRLRRGDAEGAVPVFIEALDRDITRQPSLLGLAMGLTRSGRGDEALRWLDWLEELHGPAMESLVLRIEALQAAGRFTESLAVAEAGLGDRPGDWMLHLLAAQSGVGAGLCEVAVQHVEQGRPTVPEHRRIDFERITESIATGAVTCDDP